MLNRLQDVFKCFQHHKVKKALAMEEVEEAVKELLVQSGKVPVTFQN